MGQEMSLIGLWHSYIGIGEAGDDRIDKSIIYLTIKFDFNQKLPVFVAIHRTFRCPEHSIAAWKELSK